MGRRDNDAVGIPVDIKKVKWVNKPFTQEELEKDRQLTKQKEVMLKSKNKK